MADLHSKILDASPPRGPNSFNSMQFLGKFGTPLRKVGAPTLGNSGSTTVHCSTLKTCGQHLTFAGLQWVGMALMFIAMILVAVNKPIVR